MSATPGAARATRADARPRILGAAVRMIAEHGVEASMGAIAADAGVSKSLLHYHYASRERLLAELVRRLGARLVRREGAAIDEAPDSVLDAYWNWLAGELGRGELGVVLTLGDVRDEEVRAAAADVARLRRARSTRTVAAVFASLGLAPRVAPEVLGDLVTALVDGLALDAASARDPRAAVDAMWLALLGLAE